MLANLDTFNQIQAAQNARFGMPSELGVFNDWDTVENTLPPIEPIHPSARVDSQKRQQEEQKRKQNQPDNPSSFADAFKRAPQQPDQDAYIAEFEKAVADRENGMDTDAEIHQKVKESYPFWDELGDNISDGQRNNRSKCFALFDRIRKIYGGR